MTVLIVPELSSQSPLARLGLHLAQKTGLLVLFDLALFGLFILARNVDYILVLEFL